MRPQNSYLMLKEKEKKGRKKTIKLNEWEGSDIGGDHQGKMQPGVL